ncbi:MAG: efflux RND transporter periplasmic adaptor subunit [Hyphomicrobiaceae bacterium]
MKRTLLAAAFAAGAMVAAAATGLLPATLTDTLSAMAGWSREPGDSAVASEQSVAERAPLVSVVRVRSETLVRQLSLTGTIMPREEGMVIAEVEGLRIVSVDAEVGDRVVVGRVLAQLERETLEQRRAQTVASIDRWTAAIAQAESTLVSAEAEAKLASAEVDRGRPLRDRGVLSESAFDQRVLAATSAKARRDGAEQARLAAHADLASAKAQLRELEWQLERTAIRAPFDGLVFERTARVGAIASSGAGPLFRIVRDGQTELEAEVPETRLREISVGQPATIALASGAQIEARVRLIEPRVDRQTRLARVRLELSPGAEAPIGAFARGVLEIGRKTGLVIPASAILFRGSDPFVMAVENGVVRQVPVTIGLRSAEHVIIEQGLAIGAVVVSRAGTFLAPGDRVRTTEQAYRVSGAQP